MQTTTTPAPLGLDDLDQPQADPRTAHDVRKADTDETQSLARVLTLGFADDPVFAWFFPDPSDRFERIERAFGNVFLPRLILPFGMGLRSPASSTCQTTVRGCG